MTDFSDPFSRMVRDFHVATGSTVGETPALRDVDLRMKLILEEAHELEDASWPLTVKDRGHVTHVQPDLSEAIKELCDLLYVAFGTAVAWGIDILPFFERVHRSNMSKIEGMVKRPDGKVAKGPNYRKPDFTDLLP